MISYSLQMKAPLATTFRGFFIFMERLFKFDDFEKYRVTKSGKIFSVNAGKFLQPMVRDGKYHVVSLYKKGRYHCYTKLIHRIVCKRFHKNPENKSQVNHLDGDKLNNHWLNLEWSTPRENQLHSVKMGLHGCFSREKILDTKTGELYFSVSDAARKTGIPERVLYYQLNHSKINKTTLIFSHANNRRTISKELPH